MNEPIKAGDTAIVVNGLGRNKSPNIGKTVKVLTLKGEHSVHGRVWTCTGKELLQLTDGGGYLCCSVADFPVGWLQKIDPISPVKTETKERETTE